MYYPSHWILDIVSSLVKTYPRAWGLVSQALFIREESLIPIFRNYPKLWYRLKKLMRTIEGQTSDLFPPSELSRRGLKYLLSVPGPWRELGQVLKDFDEHYTDDMDLLTFNRQ